MAALMLFASTQGMAPEVKTWTQASVEEFNSGVLNNTIVKNTAGGKIELLHPMRKVVEDRKDNSIPRFVSRDSEGNYAQICSYSQERIYVQRHSANGSPLGDPILVTATHVMTARFVATHPNGHFLVVWVVPSNHYQNYEIKGALYDPQGTAIKPDFRISDGPGEFRNSPTVFVNSDGEFWILWQEAFYDEHGPLNSYIYAQRYTSEGQRIGNNFELDTGEITLFKLQGFVFFCSDLNGSGDFFSCHSLKIYIFGK